jgi:hypothetical protein
MALFFKFNQDIQSNGQPVAFRRLLKRTNTRPASGYHEAAAAMKRSERKTNV